MNSETCTSCSRVFSIISTVRNDTLPVTRSVYSSVFLEMFSSNTRVVSETFVGPGLVLTTRHKSLIVSMSVSASAWLERNRTKMSDNLGDIRSQKHKKSREQYFQTFQVGHVC